MGWRPAVPCLASSRSTGLESNGVDQSVVVVQSAPDYVRIYQGERTGFHRPNYLFYLLVLLNTSQPAQATHLPP